MCAMPGADFTGTINPFGDTLLEEKFVWLKKNEKLKKLGLSEKQISKAQKKQLEDDRIRELEKAKQRRIENEQEKVRKEELKLKQEEEKNAADYQSWKKSEQDFHLKQVKLRSEIRLKQGRGHAIDYIARNLLFLEEDVHISLETGEIDNYELEMDHWLLDEPYKVFQGMSLNELEEAEKEIIAYSEVDGGKNSQFWAAMNIICNDELDKQRKKQIEDEKKRQSQSSSTSSSYQMSSVIQQRRDILPETEAYIVKQPLHNLLELEKIFRRILERNMMKEQMRLGSNRMQKDRGIQMNKKKGKEKKTINGIIKKMEEEETVKLKRRRIDEDDDEQGNDNNNNNQLIQQQDKLSEDENESDSDEEGVVDTEFFEGALQVIALSKARAIIRYKHEFILRKRLRQLETEAESKHAKEEIEREKEKERESKLKAEIQETKQRARELQEEEERRKEKENRLQKIARGLKSKQKEENDSELKVKEQDDDININNINNEDQIKQDEEDEDLILGPSFIPPPSLSPTDLISQNQQIESSSSSSSNIQQTNNQLIGIDQGEEIDDGIDMGIIDPEFDDREQDEEFDDLVDPKSGSGSSNSSGVVYDWADKYRPRKPKYANRVRTGYMWNKYNRTHYNYDNPPPKTILGYRFNILYPDLINKTRTPTWHTDESTDLYRIIRFHSGPPYEDIAFKIANKEWDRERNRGYKSAFENGVLRLYFNFKRERYRR
ncbi:MAG: putative cactin protein [Streblomastix strix]|uniref:Splicing factor Cactin n=1 Tax=Streblomastix strix TaxID=222440 RepID=A0A5J4VB08_9EUKA|nr:MAG: putative cactin protein [Streblomastix strix]